MSISQSHGHMGLLSMAMWGGEFDISALYADFMLSTASPDVKKPTPVTDNGLTTCTIQSFAMIDLPIPPLHLRIRKIQGIQMARQQ